METFSARANYNDDETATEIVVSWTKRFALVNNQYYSICASLDYYFSMDFDKIVCEGYDECILYYETYAKA